MQFTVEVVPFQDRHTSALRSLFKEQNSQQHQEDTRLRHFSDEEISAYFGKLNASEHDIIEVRDAQGKVVAAALITVIHYPEDSSMLVMFPQHCGFVKLLSLPVTAERKQYHESVAMLLARVERYWQEKGANGAVLSWTVKDPWVLSYFEKQGFVAYSAYAVREASQPLKQQSFPQDLKIRPAQASDEAALVQLLLDEVKFHEGLTPFDRLVPSWEQDSRQRLAKVWAGESLEQGASLFMVAERQEGIVGMMEVALSDVRQQWHPLAAKHYAYIYTAMVQENQRGQGVGLALLQALFAELSAYAVDAYSLHYVLANPLSNRFWQAHGFEPVTSLYQKRYELGEEGSGSE